MLVTNEFNPQGLLLSHQADLNNREMSQLRSDEATQLSEYNSPLVIARSTFYLRVVIIHITSTRRCMYIPETEARCAFANLSRCICFRWVRTFKLCHPVLNP